MSRQTRSTYSSFIHFLHSKHEDKNLISAGFNMVTITLISMSLVNLEWFTITGHVCVPYLSLGQFFWFDYSNIPSYGIAYKCVNHTIVMMMRITILLCFLAILFSLLGFFIDIIGPKHPVYKLVRQYAVPTICSTLWILCIIILSYYIISLLEQSIRKNYSTTEFSVTYGLGFYLLAWAGGFSTIGILYNFIISFHPSSQSREDDPCILDGFEDDMDTFNSPTPPPPYNIPPPPYSP